MTGGGHSGGRPSATIPFPEELLSGYLDGVLTQQEEQQVRLHLERSPEAKAILDELARLRQAARSTEFSPIEDRQWSEMPRTRASAWAFRLGTLLLAACGLGIAAVAIWQAWLGTPAGDETTAGVEWWAAALWLTGIGGGLLVFLSVLGDRLTDRRHDRYRRVLK